MYDIVIRNGTLYDGSGCVPLVGDMAIQGDVIAAVGSLGKERGRTEIDATGMIHVFVNGTQVLKDGEHTGAKPGRVVRGPGWLGSDPYGGVCLTS